MDEAKPFKQRSNIGSRVTREGHARFWERPEVKFLRATRQGGGCALRRKGQPCPRKPTNRFLNQSSLQCQNLDIREPRP